MKPLTLSDKILLALAIIVGIAYAGVSIMQLINY